MRKTTNVPFLVGLLVLVAVGVAGANGMTTPDPDPEPTIPRLTIAGLSPGMTSDRVKSVHGHPQAIASSTKGLAYQYPRDLSVAFDPTVGRPVACEVRGQRLSLDGEIVISVGDTLGKVTTDFRQTLPGSAHYLADRGHNGTLVWSVAHTIAVLDIKNWRVQGITLRAVH